MSESEGKKEEAETKKIIHTYPLVRHCDMIDEMRGEAMELCVTACEKHAANNEMAARMIKEAMDKKFGPSWHAVVGEGYGFEISYECKNLLYMFFGGNVGVCVWKCS
ncbi:dynein axonemal light chain 4-like [Schistocerca americana]|uniref:dynein axonemal light chain 4-like n=1 Tax=Schistocerca americana TaxID=7009 RepID=UPI001F4F967D|nr:dynein axonemal light chain 4-like [Schistocerca americana]XP_047117637.1 dynein axonemal light chain 4-like [Schistocerca piceifrons]XP_049776403.1 dynein axonemal light chain 4-like [Schistocerca cancellata]XP_049853068.1 dynein axonemal light chain 4-like isoform X2 [Schistocerca gregaria]XP_049952235.1 dynein axonemal light chain 4-like [Schistocerca serialis cubense]